VGGPSFLFSLLAQTRLWPQLLNTSAAVSASTDDKINVLFMHLIFYGEEIETVY